MDQTIFDPIDAYCERLGPGLWAEPLNAVTNLAFIVAAVICALRLGHPAPPLGLTLVAFWPRSASARACFTPSPTALTALIDVLAIAAFVFVYVFAVNRHVLGWSRGSAWASMLALVPYLALATAGFAAVPGFAVSSAYWSVCGTDRGLWRDPVVPQARLCPRPPDRGGDPGGVDHRPFRRPGLCAKGSRSARISCGTSSTRSCWAG
jgi:hypothetical protein